MERDEIAWLAVRRIAATDIPARTFDIELVEARPGYARATMKVRADMANGAAVGHGGVTFTLADTAVAFAANAYNVTTVVQTAQISFVAPVPIGEVLTAEAREVTRRGRNGVYDVRVATAAGETVALYRASTVRLQQPVLDEHPMLDDLP